MTSVQLLKQRIKLIIICKAKI